MRNVEVSFTEEEANAVIALLDIAVKADGLKIAGNAILVVQKLQAAFQRPEGEVSVGAQPPELKPSEEVEKKKK